MQWASGIAGTVVTAAIIGLTITVIDLKTSSAVSNTKLQGAIDRLTDRLEAASLLADSSLSVLRVGTTANSARIDDHEGRLRSLESDVRSLEQTRERADSLRNQGQR